MKNQESKRTIDLGQLYGGLENDNFVQLDSNYERHSKFMQGLIENTEKMVENQYNAAQEEDKYGLYATPEERKKIDIDKVEENENVQLNSPNFYEHHHQQVLDEIDRQADKLEKEMQMVEAEKKEEDYKSPFKTVNHAELYEGINLQTKFHTDEFNERVEAYEK